MSNLHLFLAASFGSIFLLQPTTSSYCLEFSKDDCQKTTSFVPGHHLIGEGFDITTLSRKGAAVVDTSQWQGPNGTCALCQNPLMNMEMQRLPLAVADWSVNRRCNQKKGASVKHSELGVADAMTEEVKNDWKVGLGLGLPAIQAAFGGSRSPITIHTQQYFQRDSYSFIKHETNCIYYQLRHTRRPPLPASHFSRDVSSLPKEYHREGYQHFINTYGTHYISQVELGARTRHLYMVRNCAVALAGFTVSDLEDCLTSEAPDSSKCRQISKDHSQGNLRGFLSKWHVEVTGGAEPEKVLFSGGLNSSDWMRSAKRHPEVVSYSLISLHTLLKQSDPRRKALKQAISDYITERALKKSCDEQCPHNGFPSPKDHCACMCRANSLNDNLCCARTRGKAQLKFYVRRAFDLYGDDFSATDGYVKVFFQGRERRTKIILGNDNPQWRETLDFGTVTLEHRDNSYKLEVWDNDSWEDDSLHSFDGHLKSGGPYEHIKYLKYGRIEFTYELKCAPTLGGASCQTYVPLRRPASSPQKTSSRFNYFRHRVWTETVG